VAVRGYGLGINFGTSTTVAVLARPDGPFEPLLFDGSALLPSAVCLGPGGRLLVGLDALHAALAAPERFEPHPRRRIDDGAVRLGEAEVAVVDLVAAVLGRVAAHARRVGEGDPGATVLTHPASWGPRRLDVLRAAAATAKLPRVRMVAEPVAAAGYLTTVGGSGLPVGGPLVVYDLGAGTFDATVVRRTDSGLDVLAGVGLDDTGALDIDAAIVGHLGGGHPTPDPELWQRLAHPATTADRRAALQLWEHVRAGKHAVSRCGATVVRVPLLERDVPLSREQLDRLALPTVDRTIEATRAALRDANLHPADPATLVLVGGGSRLPLVATALHRGIGIPPTLTKRPELVVAEGSLRLRDLLGPRRHAAAHG
jgi:molecular chaperone DnaK (HSP70)